MKTPISLFIIFLLGSCVGWFVKGLVSADTEVSAGETTQSPVEIVSAEPEEPVAVAAIEPDQVEVVVPEDSAEYNDSLQVAPKDLAGLINAKVVDLERRRSELVSSEDPLAQVLQLSDQELDELNAMWAKLLPRMDRLRVEHIRHQELENGGMWIGVENFTDAAEPLRQHFILTTLGTLGEERGGVFLDGIQAHNAFGRWGKGVSSGFVIYLWDQGDDGLLYEIIEQDRADGAPGRRWSVPEIPEHLKELAEAAGIATVSETPE